MRVWRLMDGFRLPATILALRQRSTGSWTSRGIGCCFRDLANRAATGSIYGGAASVRPAPAIVYGLTGHGDQSRAPCSVLTVEAAGCGQLSSVASAKWGELAATGPLLSNRPLPTRRG